MTTNQDPISFPYAPLSELQRNSAYSRVLWNEEVPRKETWEETNERVCKAVAEMGGLTQEEFNLILTMQLQRKAFGSARALFVVGTEWFKNPDHFSSAFNCTSFKVDSWDIFAKLMDLAMMGSGTGAVLEKKYISKLPTICNKLEITVNNDLGIYPKEVRSKNSDFYWDEDCYVLSVGDSRQGWVKAYRLLLELSSETTYPRTIPIVVSLANVRPKGEPLKGFGGVSNPSSLPELFPRVAAIFNAAVGRQLTAEECCLIIDYAAETVVAGNIRRCIAHGERVSAIDGMKPIEDIKVGDLVLTSSGEYRPVINFFRQGKQDTVEVLTSVGSIRCTPNHRVAVFDSLNTYSWKQVKDLTSRDRLISVPHQKGLLNSSTDWAWLVGYFLGDGYADLEGSKRRKGGGGEVVFAMHSYAFYGGVGEKLMRILASLGYSPTPDIKENQASICVYRKELAEELIQYKAAFSEPVVPAFIWKASTNIRAAFLAGLADADGNKGHRNVALNSTYVGFLRQIQKLYLSIGIVTTFHEREPKVLAGRDKIYRGCHWLHVRGLQSQALAVGLLNPHTARVKFVVLQAKKNGLNMPFEFVHQMVASGWKASTASTRSLTMNSKSQKGVYRDANWDTLLQEGIVNPSWKPIEVIAIAPAGESLTYDIEVEGDHEFICEGLLVHNSAGMRQFDADEPVFKINLWTQDEEGNWKVDQQKSAMKMANHTRVWHKKPTKQEVLEAVKLQFQSGEGAIQYAPEAIARGNADLLDTPTKKYGFIQSYLIAPEAAGDYLRSIATIDDEELQHRLERYYLNPCVTEDTWVQTYSGARQVKQLLDNRQFLVLNGISYSTTTEGFFKSGDKQTIIVETQEGFKLELTPNHKLQLKDNSWIEAGNLKTGDQLKVHDHRSVAPWQGSGTFEEGWMLGSLVGNGCFYDKDSNSAILRFWEDDQQEMKDYAVSLIKENLSYASNLNGGRSEINDYSQVCSTGLAKLASEFGITHGNKVVTPEIEQSSYTFYQGFLRGLFDADGSPQGSIKKGMSVRLNQSSLPILEAVQRMLLRMGIYSTIYQDRKKAGSKLMPDGKGGQKSYECKANHELVIAKEGIQLYYNLIGFKRRHKQERLASMVSSYTRPPYKSKYLATIKTIYLGEVKPVYDCTVPDAHYFDANGFVAHNCGEIIGRNLHCNLSSVHLNTLDPFDLSEQELAFKASALQCAAYLNRDFTDPLYQQSRELDPIVGVSWTGGFTFFVKLFGIDWLKWWQAGRPASWGGEIRVNPSMTPFADKTPAKLTSKSSFYKLTEFYLLSLWKEVVNKTVWDYCDRHGLKRPNRCTTLKPEGCGLMKYPRVFDQGVMFMDELEPEIEKREKGFQPLEGFTVNGDRVSHTYNNGKAEICKITLENNRVLEFTHHHPFSVDGQWIEAQDLQVGQILDFKVGTYCNKVEAALLAPTRQPVVYAAGNYGGIRESSLRQYQYPETMNPDLAYLIGAYYANGSFTTAERIKLHCQYYSVHEKVQRIWKEYFGIKTNIIRSKDRDSYVQDFASAEARNWFSLNQLDKDKSTNIERIPLKVRQSSVDSLLAFFAGYADNDGCFHSDTFCINSSSEEFIRHLQQIGEAIGLAFGFSVNSKRKGFSSNPMYGITMSRTYSETWAIDAINAHSVKATSKPVQPSLNGKRYVRHPFRIKQIEFVQGEFPTYDIHVENTHWYYQGGIKSHNSLSLLTGVGCNSFHPPKGWYYIRRMTVEKGSPIGLAAIDYGYDVVPSQKDTDENGVLLNDPFDSRCTEWLIEVPVAEEIVQLYPEAESIDPGKFSALAQFDFYMQVQKYYVAHNTSATIELEENEIEDVSNYIYDLIQNDEGYISAALLQRFDAKTSTYPRLPFEPISKEEYEKLQAEVLERRGDTDFQEAFDFYFRNASAANALLSDQPSESACSSGQCEMRVNQG